MVRAKLLAIGVLFLLVGCGRSDPPPQVSETGQILPKDSAHWLRTVQRLGQWDYHGWLATNPSPEERARVKDAILTRMQTTEKINDLRPLLVYAAGIGVQRDRSTHPTIQHAIEQINASSTSEWWRLVETANGPWIANGRSSH